MANINWTLKDFKAYLFIYCSFADHLQVPAERNYAIEKVGKKRFLEIHNEIEGHTDDVSINKIRKYVQHHKLTDQFINELLDEVKGIFLIDGEFHKLEKRLFGSLQNIFTKYKNT